MKKIFLLFLLTLSTSLYLQAQLNIAFEGQLNYTEEMSDVWGYTDALGNEYALVGTTDGVAIIDISTPSSPTELHYIDGTFTFWRDLKTYGDYAYVINEAANGGGLLIIDLSDIGTSVTTYNTNLGVGFTDCHNIYIDENGIGYLFGASTSGTGNVGNGTLMIDIAADPTDPDYLGIYNTNYVHDGFVRGDTLWAAEIYAGKLTVVDVSNKTSPSILGSKSTPKNFAHAVWVSDDNQTAFVTDEKNGAWVVAYDVSDVGDIKEIDRYQSFPGTNVIPHNTFVKGNFVVNSYYTSGVVILDATHPDNIIEVGNYDTSTGFSGSGFNGCWGVYPYFPSGAIIATDIETGLYVLTPTYVQACYLEGTVTDADTDAPIANAQVQIIGAVNAADATDLSGIYKTGVANTGTYNVEVVAEGYVTQYIEVEFLTNGTIVTLDVQMSHPCLSPENFNTIETDYHTASLSWDAANGANTYAVRYRQNGTSTWQNTSTETTDISLNNLQGCTNYEYQVASQCDSGDSEYSATQTFETTIPNASWTGISILECDEPFDFNALVTGNEDGTWSGGNYISSEGTFNPDGLAEGNYPVTYTVGEFGCVDGKTLQVVVSTCKFDIRLKAYLEGAYSNNGTMNAFLQYFSLIPSDQPFDRTPWDYNGTENLTNIPTNMTDWVLVEVRDANDMSLLTQRAGILLTDGKIVDTDGVSDLEIEGLMANQDYFIAVRARNHLAVMSSSAVTLPNTEVYDFTSSDSQVLGSNQLKETSDGSYTLIAGDINSDGVVTVEDFNVFVGEIAKINQYLDSDLNQDRAVTVIDFNIYQQNASKVAIPLLRY